jgi:hypothetical protein
MGDDEYYGRYKKVEHGQLYRELTAGSPPNVDTVADVWHTTAQTIQASAADLRADLATLQSSWSGQTSDEFQYRLGLVATFADTVAGEAMNMYTGLSAMSGALTTAQTNGRPAPVPAVDWQHDTVLGTLLGHTVTAADATQSQQDLAAVVAKLAISYGVAANTQWSAPRPEPSPDLPGQSLAIDLGVAAPPAATAAAAASGTATQLAGSVGAPPAPNHSALSLAPLVSGAPGSTAMPANPGMAVTMLQGADGSTSSARTVAAGAGAGGTDTGSSASLPPPVMGTGGFAPGSASENGVISRPLHDDETAWAASEDNGWANPDQSPPPVLGHPTRPA